MTPENSPISPRHVSPENPVTARIFLKTIIKPLMPFFPSCILVLGVIFSPRTRRLRRHSGQGSPIPFRRTFAPAARSVLPFAAPRIFDNCIDRHQPARHSVFRAGQAAVTRNNSFFQRICCRSLTGRRILGLCGSVRWMRLLAPLGQKFRTNLIPQSDSRPRQRKLFPAATNPAPATLLIP
jgi:hypothetical protein